MEFSKGDKVRVVSCEIHPEYVGLEGTIAKVVDSDDGLVYKVRSKGRILRSYATADCLEAR